MPNRQSQATGNWTAAGTWVGGIVPQAGDTVEIMAGHTVTIDANINAIAATTIRAGGTLVPAFQMTTNPFTDITVENGAYIYASRAASSILRFSGKIYVYGVNGVNYGTVADPIPIAVGACLRCVCTTTSEANRQLVFYVDNAITMHGAVRIRETTLAAQALVGANTVVLTDDLALRPGTGAQAIVGTADAIVILHTPVYASGLIFASNDSIDAYAVANYNAGTKTVTLGDIGAMSNTNFPRGGTNPAYNTIDVQREIGTRVLLISSNVTITGSATNQYPHYFMATTKVDPTLTLNYMAAWNVVHLVQTNPISNTIHINVNDCAFNSIPSDYCFHGASYIANDCYIVGADFDTGVKYSTFNDCYFVGGLDGTSGGYGLNFNRCLWEGKRTAITGSATDGEKWFRDCTFRGMLSAVSTTACLRMFTCAFVGMYTTFSDCYDYYIEGCTFTTIAAASLGGFGCVVDCNLGTSTLFTTEKTAFYNTTSVLSLSGGSGVAAIGGNPRITSYDDNGVVGSFLQLQYGGKIVSAGAFGPLVASYLATFTSALSPTVFDQDVYCPSERYTYIEVWLQKSANGMTTTPRVQLVAPGNDPLYDGVAIDQEIMTDDLTLQHIVLIYQPANDKLVTLRITGTNGSGTLQFGFRVVMSSGEIVGGVRPALGRGK